MAEFEVGVFNKEVREAVAGGDRHRDLSDDWADIHYVIITAADEDTARRTAQRRYPAQRGYIIDSINPAAE